MSERKAKPKAKRAPASKATRASGKKASAKANSLVQGDWREAMLAEIRRLIQEADPEMVEERKWVKPTNPAGVSAWSHGGLVCTGETYKQVVKVTFFRGAALDDADGLFNASLDGNARRAIDIREGEKLDAKAFKALIKAAVAENLGGKAPKAKPTPKKAAKTKPASSKSVTLLSGGNPQIAKADGDAPVQAYIAACPGFKRDIGRWLDDLIERNVPNVRKAVKWNSPFYGIEGQGWFLSTHCLTKYVKVTFFKGTSLKPIPPGGTPKSGESRWIDIYENDERDDGQMANWVKQAAAIPGWMTSGGVGK